MADTWDYQENGDNWNPEGSGKLQSPIDIPRAALLEQQPVVGVSPKPMEFYYTPVLGAECELFRMSGRPTKCCCTRKPNGEARASLGSMVLDGKEFEASEFHFHAPAEHLFDMERYPLEMHIVHKFKCMADRGSVPRGSKILDDYNLQHEDEIVVLGVLFKPGEVPNPAANQFFCNLLGTFGVLKSVAGNVTAPIDLTQALGIIASGSATVPQTAIRVFRYFGSLTTPPCTEVVHWCLLPSPIEIPEHFIRALAATMQSPSCLGTYRNVSQRGLPAELTAGAAAHEEPLVYYAGQFSGCRKQEADSLPRPVYLCKALAGPSRS